MSYDFTIKNKKYTVPAFADIPVGALRKARHAQDDMDKAFIILEESVGIDSEILGVLDKLSMAEFGEWLSGWTGGAELGESSDSES
jgi:hypothetical protein